MGSDHELVGKVGRVTGQIDPGRLGEVMVPVRGVAEAFTQVLGMGASTIPLLRGMLDQTQANGKKPAASVKHD